GEGAEKRLLEVLDCGAGELRAGLHRAILPEAQAWDHARRLVAMARRPGFPGAAASAASNRAGDEALGRRMGDQLEDRVPEAGRASNLVEALVEPEAEHLSQRGPCREGAEERAHQLPDIRPRELGGPALAFRQVKRRRFDINACVGPPGDHTAT